MSERMKVGVIGVGAIGNVHAESYQANAERAELVALCDVNEKRLAEIAKKFNVKQQFGDYRDLLKSDVQAVSVCVGNALHREVAIAALKAGKHVLLEKPMAMNAGQAADIVAAAKKSRKILKIGMSNRQTAEADILREQIQAGLFGEIYHMRTVLIRRRGIPGMGGWFTTKAASGGGPLIDIGVHWFDIAMFISGLWNPVRVSAMTYTKFGSKMRDYKYVNMWAGPPNFKGTFDVEDYATGVVRFAKGATMSFDIAWAANLEQETFVDILGDKAGVRILDGKPMKILTEHHKHIADVLPKFKATPNNYHQQARRFLAACGGEDANLATGEQGMTVMKVIDAVYESSAQRREVAIG